MLAVWLFGNGIFGNGISEAWADPASASETVVLVAGEEHQAFFDVPLGVDPGQVAHRYRLALETDALAAKTSKTGQGRARLIVTQGGIDVGVVPFDGEIPGSTMNFHLDRFEEEIFRLPEASIEFEIRPVEGGERKGSYRVRFERPIAEDPERRSLEERMSEASAVKHGDEASRLRHAAELYESLAEEFSAAADLFPAGEHERLRARALLGAANHRRLLGEAEAAEALYLDAASIWRQVQEPGWTAASLVGAAQGARRQGKLAVARSRLEQALTLWSSLPARRTEVAQTESNLGLIAHIEGDFVRASLHYSQALEEQRAAGRDREVANISLNLGHVESQLGDAEAALTLDRASLEIFRRLGDRRGELDALIALALLHQRMAAFETALQLFADVRSLAAELEDRRLEGRALGNRGFIYLGLGRFTQAVGDLERGLELAEQAGDFNLAMNAQANLAEVAEARGHFNQAKGHWQAALELAEELGHRKGATFLGQLGRLEAMLGEGDGEELFRSAFERDLGGPADEAFLNYRLGEARIARGAPVEAVAPLEAARQTWRRAEYRAGEALATMALGEAHLAAGQSREAIETLDEAVHAVESIRHELANPSLRSAFLARRMDAYRLLVEALVDAGHIERALAIGERAKGRSLLDVLASRAPGLGELPEESRQEKSGDLLRERRLVVGQLALTARRRQLETLGRRQPVPGDDVAARLHALHARLDLLDTRLSSPETQSLAAEPIDVEPMQRLLDDGTALLHFTLGQSRSHLWVVTRTAMRHLELAPRAEIEAGARRLHRAWGAPGSSADELEAEFEMSRLLLTEAWHLLAPEGNADSEPVGAASRHKRVERLVIIADGALHYIPFASLPAPRDRRSVEAGRVAEERLVHRFEIASLPSASVLAQDRQNVPFKKPPRLVVLADPVFDRRDPRLMAQGPETDRVSPFMASMRGAGFDVESSSMGALGRLPGSGVEAQAIASYLPPGRSQVILGFDANRDAAELSLEGSTLVHFATHGLIDTDHPEISGLALSQFSADGRRRSDGFLRLHDLRGLDLEAELVVLSGCRTALGRELDGEAFQGLVSGFQRAGARRVLASLWAVADRATAEWMDEFYRGLLAENLSPAAALRQAQLHLSRDRRYADPYYWAGFVMQGDWR